MNHTVTQQPDSCSNKPSGWMHIGPLIEWNISTRGWWAVDTELPVDSLRCWNGGRSGGDPTGRWWPNTRRGSFREKRGHWFHLQKARWGEWLSGASYWPSSTQNPFLKHHSKWWPIRLSQHHADNSPLPQEVGVTTRHSLTLMGNVVTKHYRKHYIGKWANSMKTDSTRVIRLLNMLHIMINEC